jgi:hypothetical protein
MQRAGGMQGLSARKRAWTWLALKRPKKTTALRKKLSLLVCYSIKFWLGSILGSNEQEKPAR